MLRRPILTAIVVAAASGAIFHAQPQRVDFVRDVQPILRQNCYGCHGPQQHMSNFRLDRRSDAMRGGTIAVIGPGNSEGSRLYMRLVGSDFGPQMPPTGKLNPEQIAIIKAWIDQGAEWPDSASGEVPPAPPDPKAARVINALRDGDTAGFKAAVAADPSAVNLKGPGGTTPLMFAALYGDTAAVKQLLDGGADPNARNDAGATALMWAVSDFEKTRILIEHGADVNVASADRRTALMIAAGLPGGARVVRLLLDHGANVQAQAPGLVADTTPLLESLYSGDEESFTLLAARGANVNAGGGAALGLALRAECRSCVERLLKSIDSSAFTANMLIGAPPGGPALATPLLLEHGADVNARDPQGRTMLMLAAASDAMTPEITQLLVSRGADVNAVSPAGETALGLARMRGDTAVVTVLLKAGANDTAPPSAPAVKPLPAASVRAALERSLPLLQRNDETFLRKAGCVSCHNNTLTAMTVAAARGNGLPVNEAIARQQVTTIANYIETWRERALQGNGIPGDSDTVSYILLGLAAEKHPADFATDALAHFLKRQQSAEGQWRILAHRPPIESSDIQVTAASMRAIQLYAPKVGRADYDRAVQRAAAWLAKAPAWSLEDRAFQLLGLGWAHADKARIAAARQALVAEQRPDGGWAQLPSLQSDAYATGQALVALIESGSMTVADPVYKRGVQFLLNTQFADGSWFVKSRAIPIQPFFESGFPFGRDQFISAAGSNWASMALALGYRKPS
jgi:ankyrin repeat protein